MTEEKMKLYELNPAVSDCGCGTDLAFRVW